MARYDLVIVGMGSGGMVGAEFAATIGLRVAVVEQGRVGGDCLWTGCVPSKTLLASARVAHQMRHADRWGLTAVDPGVDSRQVWDRIHAVQARIAGSDDDPARFEAMGIEIVRGRARLEGPNTVAVTPSDGAEGAPRTLEARVILLCTGSRPGVPPVAGLEEAGFLTSENLFDLDEPPASLLLLGAGPIGLELAQAFVRLGIPATVLERESGMLPREEPDLVDTLARILREEGVDLRFDVEAQRVSVEGGRKVIEGLEAGRPARWEADGLLVGAGRRPNVEGLNLEGVGVETGRRGVVVDERMRSSVPSIYAAGDVAGRFLFTHSAAYEAVRAVRDAFYPGKGKVTDLVPWCTFTDPELAHAGLTEAEARERHGDDVEVYRLDLDHSDRARAEGTPEGAVVVVTAKGRVVGAHILAPTAGELIHELALAVNEDLKLSDLASLIHVYPTLATAVGQLAGEAAFEGARRYRWLVRKER